MAGHLTSDDIQRISDRPFSPGFRQRFNRWAARPIGLWTLELAGITAAVALGYGIARHNEPADVRGQLAAEQRQAADVRRSLDQRDLRISTLTSEKARLEQQASQAEGELDTAIAAMDEIQKENDQLKQAATVFSEARRIVLPRTPAPLPIRVPQATVIAINHGAKEGVMPDGRGGFVVVRRPSPSVNDALAHGLQKPPQIAALTPPELAHGGKAIELISPLATVVRPGPVMLRWVKAPGATSYTVILQDEKGADVLGKDGEKVTASETPFGVQWAVPKTLPPGTYHWQVIAHLADGSQGRTLSAAGKPAGFAVLDAKRSGDLKAAEAQFAGNQLELGVRYAKLGLLDDAEAALIPFVAAYPDSPQTKRLLEAVRGWRRFKNGGRL